MVLDPLAQIHPVTILAVIAIFVVTLVVLRRIFFLPLIGLMEARNARIEAARTRKAEACASLAAAEAQAEELLSRARQEAASLTEAARTEAADLRSTRLRRASAEADAILAQGREEVRLLRLAHWPRRRSWRRNFTPA
jgi:F0F1-type ATP synthase membrane subunit b/b'